MKPLLFIFAFLLSSASFAQNKVDTIRVCDQPFKVLPPKKEARYPYKMMMSNTFIYIDTPYNDSTGTVIESMSISFIRNGVSILDLNNVSPTLFQSNLFILISTSKPGDKLLLSNVKITDNKKQHLSGLVKPLTLVRI